MIFVIIYLFSDRVDNARRERRNYPEEIQVQPGITQADREYIICSYFTCTLISCVRITVSASTFIFLNLYSRKFTPLQNLITELNELFENERFGICYFVWFLNLNWISEYKIYEIWYVCAFKSILNMVIVIIFFLYR